MDGLFSDDFAFLAITAFVRASESDELREKAKAMQREAAELAERGHREEAANVKRRVMEMLEEAERVRAGLLMGLWGMANLVGKALGAVLGGGVVDLLQALTGEAAAFLDPFYSPGSDFIAIGNQMIGKTKFCGNVNRFGYPFTGNPLHHLILWRRRLF